ncbi:Gfo/Idh/MocA family protein [Cohnella faecalis]|uniref:Gfo/Idh/MocA family protein n=1 Tax=Cohnella faecalis TaxID=2315694 RepID=UPI003617DE01
MAVRVGVIGCGSIARHRHLPELSANPNVKLVAVCDVNERTANEMAEKFNTRAHTDYKELINADDIDAILVLATNVTHASMSIEALQAGKHVLCEKPLALSVEEATRMIQTAEETGKYLMIGHNQRLVPTHIRAKEILKSGKLGKIHSFKTVFGHRGCEYWAVEKEATWFFDKKFAGLGCSADLGIHKADLIRWLLEEEFAEVSSFVETQGKRNVNGDMISVDDNMVALLKSRSGIIGTLTSSWTYATEDNGTTIYGEKGIMRIFDHAEYDLIIEVLDGPFEYHKISAMQTNSDQSDSGVSKLFIECILQNRKPEISAEEGLAALKIILACHESSQTGTTVKL